jgi:hypothetical protein
MYIVEQSKQQAISILEGNTQLAAAWCAQVVLRDMLWWYLSCVVSSWSRTCQQQLASAFIIMCMQARSRKWHTTTNADNIWKIKATHRLYVSVFEGRVYTRFYTLRHAPVYRRVGCNEIHACQDTPGHVSVSGACLTRVRVRTRLDTLHTRPHV